MSIIFTVMPFAWAYGSLAVFVQKADKLVPPLPTVSQSLPIRYEGVVDRVFAPSRMFIVKHGSIWYGKSKLSADSIALYQDAGIDPVTGVHYPAGTGVATGHVALTDPFGTMNAEQIVFNWEAGTAQGGSVVIHLPHTTIASNHIAISPTQWNLGPSRIYDDHALTRYQLKANSIEVIPGKTAIAKEFEAKFLGTTVYRARSQSFSLSQTTTGLRLPNLSYSQRDGAGINFLSTLLVGENSSALVGFSGSRSAIPSYGLLLAHSFAPRGTQTSGFTPPSEFDLRFGDDYFQNVLVGGPANSYIDTGQARQSVSLGSFWNIAPDDRLQNSYYQQPLEAVYDASQNFGLVAARNTFRLEGIRQAGSAVTTRLVSQGTLAAKPWVLGPRTEVYALGNYSAFLGGKAFSWVRGEVGATYRPAKDLRFGAAYAIGHEFGNPLFLDDALIAIKSFSVRCDFRIGPRGFGYLARYNSETQRWFDQEVYVTQLAGAVEPYFSIRTFPSSFRLGVNIRIDSWLRQLSHRNPDGSKPVEADDSIVLK